MGNYKLSRNSKKNLKGIKSNLIDLVERSLKKSEHDFGIPKYGGFRSPQLQNNLYHQRPKVTQLDGFKRKSYHQTGNAFDIFIFHDGRACWDCPEKYRAVWKIVKIEFAIMQAEGLFEKDEEIQWGGNWRRFKDLPHFQIKKV